MPDTDAPPKVLVVDDRPQAAKLMRLQLRSFCDALIATSYDEAVQIADENDLDVAILDIQLGDNRTGVDLLHELRAMPHLEDLRAIACTAYAVPGSRKRFIEAGFDEYMGKPITKRQLTKTIERLMDPEYRASRVSHARDEAGVNVPPSPAVLSSIMELLAGEDPEPDVQRLVELLQDEPVVVSIVLRHVNSPFYGLSSRVDSVERAVTLLGFQPVCNLVLTELVTQAFADDVTPLVEGIYDSIRQQSLGAALLARAFGEVQKSVRPENAYTAGVLHQIGRFALLSDQPEKYHKLWEETDTPLGWKPPRLREEVRTFRTDYVRTGAELARAWRLPEEQIMTIRYHRAPDHSTHRRYRSLCFTMHAAYHVSQHILHGGGDPETREEARTAIVKLANETSIDASRFRSIVEKHAEDVRSFVLD